jgi:diadenosine tetraphosphatase ApaH/serine/threonine PP2A family protein phosphatase
MPGGWRYVLDAEEARASFEATKQRLIMCGHVHVPELYHLSAGGALGALTPSADTGVRLSRERRWLAVIGAVGQPRDAIAAACYAVLDEEQNSLTYVRVAYDVASAAAKIREAGLPPVLALRLEEGW